MPFDSLAIIFNNLRVPRAMAALQTAVQKSKTYLFLGSWLVNGIFLVNKNYHYQHGRCW